MSWTAFNRINHFFEHRKGPLVFIAKQKVLAYLAEDLLTGLDPQLTINQRVLVFCGIHNGYHAHHWRRGYKLGIQTEQFLNQEGEQLWRYESFLPKVMKHLERFDQIIDINSSNKPVYDRLPSHIRQKIRFGPHIFPANAPAAKAASRSLAAFVGDGSGRRTPILASLEAKQRAELIKSELYGQPLLDELSPYAAILNIHYDRGSYTEAPRLLLALNAGKAVVSEPLSDDFIEGVHYLSLDHPLDSDQLAKVHQNFSTHVCSRFSFQQQLVTLGLASLPKAKHDQYTG